MADAMTVVGSVNSVQTAYDRLARFALRPNLYFDMVADVRPTRQTQPGLVVKFPLWADFAVASTPLNESVDVDAVAASDSQITVTLLEQGNAALTSARLRAGSFLEVDTDIAALIGYNAGISLDTIAANVLVAGSNVRYATGGATDPTARNTVEPGDTLAADDARRARTDLAAANVMAWPDGLYRAFIHPDVALDLRTATGTATWRDPHVYSKPDEIWNGTIGAFEGFSFIETSTAPKFADAGSSTTLTDVYATLFVGRQALAKAYSSTVSADLPQVVRGEVIDKLRRFQPIGWYWLGGYSIYRQAAVRRVESSSSIGVNA